MKRLLPIFLIAATCIATAQAQTQLRVRLADNSPMHIAVNGRYFDKRGTTITVGDLPPGRHSLKIYTMKYDRWGSNYEHLLYQGAVRTSYGMVTNFTYDPYNGYIDVQDLYIDDNATHNPNPDNNQYSANYDNGADKTRTDNDTYSPSTSPAASPVAAGELATFTDDKAAALKEKVAAIKTDTEKLKLLKDELKNESLTTKQVSTIMDWVLFESTKMEFVKWAYPITIDQENYNTLPAKFAYKSSQEELENFIEKKK